MSLYSDSELIFLDTNHYGQPYLERSNPSEHSSYPAVPQAGWTLTSRGPQSHSTLHLTRCPELLCPLRLIIRPSRLQLHPRP